MEELEGGGGARIALFPVDLAAETRALTGEVVTTEGIAAMPGEG